MWTEVTIEQSQNHAAVISDKVLKLSVKTECSQCWIKLEISFADVTIKALFQKDDCRTRCVRETSSVSGKRLAGNVLSGNRPVRETSCPGNVRTQVKSRMKEDLYPSSGFFEPIKTHLMCHTFSSHVNKYLKHSQQNIAKIRQLIPKTIQTSNIETPNNVNRRISISYLTELYLTSS